MDTKSQTVLVIRPITRCELGEDLSLGLIVDVFDRCAVLNSGKWTCGTRWYSLRNDRGEKFHATDHQVQLDVRA